MATVNQILQDKGGEVFGIAPQATIYEALQRMADKGVGALLVLDDGELIGIFSERDYARKVILFGKTPQETQVREIMTGDVICVTMQQSAEKCLAIMTDKRVRHLPVLGEDEQLVGVVSIGDVVKSIITEQRVLINHLEDYIHS